MKKLETVKELENFRDFEKERVNSTEKLLKARKVQLVGIDEQMADIEKKLKVVKNLTLISKLDKEYQLLETRKKELEDSPVKQLSSVDNQRRKKKLNYYELLVKLKGRLDTLSIENKKIMVEALIDEVVLAPITSRYFTMTIKWYSSSDTYLIKRDRASGNHWDDEEENKLFEEMYATASIPALLQAFPSCNWQALKEKGYRLGLKREVARTLPVELRDNPVLLEYSVHYGYLQYES